MQVQVPQGMGPGMALQVATPDGQTVQLVIPDGVGPGMMFQAQYQPQQMAQPMMAQPMMGQPMMGQPMMGQPMMGQPQMVAPAPQIIVQQAPPVQMQQGPMYVKVRARPAPAIARTLLGLQLRSHTTKRRVAVLLIAGAILRPDLLDYRVLHTVWDLDLFVPGRRA